MSCARLPSDTDRGCAESRGLGGDTLTTTRRGKARCLPVLQFIVPEHQPHAENLDTVSGPGHFSIRVFSRGDSAERYPAAGWGRIVPGKSSFGGRARGTGNRQALLANSGGDGSPARTSTNLSSLPVRHPIWQAFPAASLTSG